MPWEFISQVYLIVTLQLLVLICIIGKLSKHIRHVAQKRKVKQVWMIELACILIIVAWPIGFPVILYLNNKTKE